MERTTIICDECGWKQANETCQICESDICRECIRNMPIIFNYDKPLITIKMCKKCCDNLMTSVRINNKKESWIQTLTPFLIKFFRDNLALDELEKKPIVEPPK